MQARYRLTMGCIAFVTLQIMEIYLGYMLMLKSFREYCHEVFSTSAGIVGLLGQVIFGLIPTIISMTSKSLGESYVDQKQQTKMD